MDEVYLRTDQGTAAQARVDAMVREYQTKLARYVRRMVGEAEVALDISQDVFLAAYRILKDDPERELTAGWLYRAATNGAISFMRRRKICGCCRWTETSIAATGESTSAVRRR